jgi:hypothetical protein
VIDNVTPSEIEATLKRMFPLETGLSWGKWCWQLNTLLNYKLKPHPLKVGFFIWLIN